MLKSIAFRLGTLLHVAASSEPTIGFIIITLSTESFIASRHACAEKCHVPSRNAVVRKVWAFFVKQSETSFGFLLLTQMPRGKPLVAPFKSLFRNCK